MKLNSSLSIQFDLTVDVAEVIPVMQSLVLELQKEMQIVQIQLYPIENLNYQWFWYDVRYSQKN